MTRSNFETVRNSNLSALKTCGHTQVYRYAYVLSWCNSTGGTDQNIEITVKSESTFQTKISFYIFTMMSIADVGWLGWYLMMNFDNL